MDGSYDHDRAETSRVDPARARAPAGAESATLLDSVEVLRRLKFGAMEDTPSERAR